MKIAVLKSKNPADIYRLPADRAPALLHFSHGNDGAITKSLAALYESNPAAAKEILKKLVEQGCRKEDYLIERQAIEDYMRSRLPELGVNPAARHPIYAVLDLNRVPLERFKDEKVIPIPIDAVKDRLTFTIGDSFPALYNKAGLTEYTKRYPYSDDLLLLQDVLKEYESGKLSKRLDRIYRNKKMKGHSPDDYVEAQIWDTPEHLSEILKGYPEMKNDIEKAAATKLTKLAADATWADGINSYKHEKYYNNSKIWDEYGIERPAFIGDPDRRDNASIRTFSAPGKHDVVDSAPRLYYGVDNSQEPFKMHQTMAHEISHASRLQPGMSLNSVFGDPSGPSNYLRNRVIEESRANLDALGSTAKNYPMQTLSKLPTELIQSEASYLDPILNEINKFNTKTKETLLAGGVPEEEATARVNNQWRGESFNKRLDNFIDNELKK